MSTSPEVTSGANDDQSSPWEGDVAPEAAPIVFDFATSSTADRSDGSHELPEADATRPARRRWKYAVGGLAVLGLGIAAIVVTTSTGDDDAAEPADDATTADTLLDLPPLPPTDSDDADEANDADTSTTDSPDSGEFDPSLAIEFDVTGNVWSSGSVEVPPRLQELSSTTLVVQTFDGPLVEIDFPTGTTRTIGLPTPGGGIVVGRSATLVVDRGSDLNPFGGTATVLVRPGEAPVAVDASIDPFSAQRRSGTDEFVAPPSAPEIGTDGGNDIEPDELLRILPDGSVEPWEVDSFSSLGPPSLTPNGDLLAEDGGNVFIVGPDGSTLLAPGSLVASSVRHALTRECNVDRVCTATLHDFVTGGQQLVEVAPAALGLPFVRSVSPDGRYLLDSFIPSDNSAVLTDLATGEEVVFPADRFQGVSLGPNEVWAPDSSGFFRQQNGGLEFWDVATQEGTRLPIDQVSSFGVRNDLAGVPPAPELTTSTGAPMISIRGVTIDGDFFEIDFASGEISAVAAPPSVYVGERARVIGDDRQVLAVTANGRLSVGADTSSSERIDLDFSTDHPIIASQRGLGWRFDNSGGTQKYRLFNPFGEDLGVFVDVPVGAAVVGSDERGGVLAVGRDGVVALYSGTTELVTDGELLAIGGSYALALECSDVGCASFRINRSTGERVPVPVDSVVRAQRALSEGAGSIVENTLSPDGAVMISPAGDDPTAPAWRITDLSGGAVIAAPTPKAGTAVAWSGDSQHAVFLGSDSLHLYDRAAGTVITLDRAPPLVSFIAT